MRCHKCQFLCDESDAFCRKCGASLAQEGDFSEVMQVGETPPGVETVAAVQVIEQGGANLPAVVERPKKPGALSKVARALSSETGQKVVKGAAIVVASVAAELISQAAAAREKQKAATRARSSNPATNAIVRAINSATQPDITPYNPPSSGITPGGRTESYYYYYERWIIRRTTRHDS